MKRQVVFAYGLLAYGVFAAWVVLAIGFLSGLYGKTVDAGPATPATAAVLIDLGLLLVFAGHHSLAARSGFKAWLARHLPSAAERSTYVLIASVLMLVVIWQWRPLPQPLWSLDSAWAAGIVYGLHGLGWVIVFASTFQISHWQLFGLEQVYRYWRALPAATDGFHSPWLYRLVRHPMMTGLIVVFWTTPTMTLGRLLFAGVLTGYILVATRWEERDLERELGEAYRRYRARTPRLLPGVPVSGKEATEPDRFDAARQRR
ncbi:isoprenylcysteine carboxylmethyltransferase family protein [Ectothiorhodospiraceae bacterium WFHF3C12]|nr:isoprenylcysteine carboxylmethyltransferase family protein [Ectothiorhodospiraceae bacterium WFHF3C12]